MTAPRAPLLKSQVQLSYSLFPSLSDLNTSQPGKALLIEQLPRVKTHNTTTDYSSCLPSHRTSPKARLVHDLVSASSPYQIPTMPTIPTRIPFELDCSVNMPAVVKEGRGREMVYRGLWNRVGRGGKDFGWYVDYIPSTMSSF